MGRFSYQDRDYSFGQSILSLRSLMGITQNELADLLGVSRRAVGAWEAGSKYPSVNNIKRFIELAVQYKAFHAGHEEDEIRVLWQASRQKVLLNESWLKGLLSSESGKTAASAQDLLGQVDVAAPPSEQAATQNIPRTDWDDAITVQVFYGREWETSLLTEWMVDERCRVVSILGMGGIGKSTLAVTLMRQLSSQFEIIIWRSLRDIPNADVLLDDLFQVLAPYRLSDPVLSFDRRLGLLLEHMRNNRILLVLDNLESVLEEGEQVGFLRAGYESFGQFLRRSAETDHQSCLLLTSREKANDLIPLEGNRAPVRTLRLARLDATSSEKLLIEKGLVGQTVDYARLVEAYAGNPLALKMVAQTIVDLFDGDINAFFEQGEVIYGSIREMLNQQFARVSSLEQSVLLWLAILRESTTLDELLAVMSVPVTRARLLEALESLRRRSLIERGKQQGSVILQSVILEYLTARIISEFCEAIETGQPSRTMIEYGIELAQAREYVREIQVRLIVMPILERLRTAYSQPYVLETQLLAMLDVIKTWEASAQDYAPANVVTLLRALREHLRGLDLSGLALRGAYLQGVEMQDSNLAHTFIRSTSFTETFDAGTAVAISSKGDAWATGSRRGEIRLWSGDGQTLRRVWRAHSDIICDLDFSPDGQVLASSGSWDGTVKLWDVASGGLIWMAKHPSQAYGLTFSSDSRLIASSGYDTTVRVWDRQTGAVVQTLEHPEIVGSVAFSPDGIHLATGDFNGRVRLWQFNRNGPSTIVRILEGHSHYVERLAFSPDGSQLATSSWDATVKIWDVTSGELLDDLTVFTDRMLRVIWSPDGRVIASSGREHIIWLWDTERHEYYASLQGHKATVYGLAFSPDSRLLLSGSDDSTLRVWDIPSARCIRLMEGYAASLYDISWSADGTQLVAGGSDTRVMVFSTTKGMAPRRLEGHDGFVLSVAWSPNGLWFASDEWNNIIHIWDARSGESLLKLHYPGEGGDYFDRMAWSPDGQRLATGTYSHGVQLFDMSNQQQSWLGDDLGVWMRHVAWHPHGNLLASGGADGTVYIFDATLNLLVQRLGGHYSSVIDVAWSADGKRLASSGRGSDGGEIFVWDVDSGQRLHNLKGHPLIVYALAWSAEGTLISADGDGIIRWWDVERESTTRIVETQQGAIQALRPNPDGTRLASCGNDGAIMIWDIVSGEHQQTLRLDRPYERVNITGINGLTDAQKESLRTLGAVEG